MKQFLTLMKRDLNDNKGALIITPIVIAGVILAIVLLTVVTGKVNFNSDGAFNFGPSSSVNSLSIDGEEFKIYKDADGNVVVQDKEGNKKAFDGKLGPEDSQKAAEAFVLGSGIGSLLPIWVALVTIIFVLSSGLFEERKDRSIMFWKSLPVSDLKTVAAKFTSIVGGGIGAAFLVSIALHFAIMFLAYIGLSFIGINVISITSAASSVINFWAVVSITLIGYILWALPIYAWFLAVGAYAPKAPFLAAVLPIALLPILAKLFAPNLVDYLLIPLQHITAQPMIESIRQIKSHTMDGSNFDGLVDVIGHISSGVANSMMQPQFFIGLLVAVGLIYGASEIRRRHAI